MSKPLSIIIVEKSGLLKTLLIKDFKEEELYKKCGFKKADDFVKQTEWSSKIEGKKYYVEVFAKTDGRANSENKYDFPPPIDNTLFFGSCAIIAYTKNTDGNKLYIDLTIPLWLKIYEKLFGGFEDLVATALEDEEEEDELANVPKEKKTKHGYLKDGFVVDSSETDDDETVTNSEEELDDDEEDDTEELDDDDDVDGNGEIGSELSEETYIDDDSKS
jgi:hypothetical protein